jgi:hypothetical protein
MISDSLYPSSRPAAQARNRSGRRLRQQSSCGAGPECEHHSIIGHGRRRKQAHDEHHNWIGIRCGRCSGCGKTFTFLPPLLLSYTHYSPFARCEALRRRFEEHGSWEEATPAVKDPNRLPDPSTVRRCAHGLDPFQPARSFLRQTLGCVAQRLGRVDQTDPEAERRSA